MTALSGRAPAVPRAVIRDRYTGVEATRLMAMVMLVISVSPMLAPLAGAGLMQVTGWRGIFGVLLVAGLLMLLMPGQHGPGRHLSHAAASAVTAPRWRGSRFAGCGR